MSVDLQSRVTVKRINNGEYDGLFGMLSDKKWPTTLHCDLGCDNYDSVPVNEDPRNKVSGMIKQCSVKIIITSHAELHANMAIQLISN